LTEEILGKLKQDISRCVLVPSDGGRFEVTIDGKLVFSKMQESRFPEHAEIFKHL
jgi:selenoprotein W-related protein